MSEPALKCEKCNFKQNYPKLSIAFKMANSCWLPKGKSRFSRVPT